MLQKKDELDLKIQRKIAIFLSLVTYQLILGWIKLVKRYRIHNLSQIRQEFEELSSKGQGPVVYCANHLTLIDSMLIIWALAPARKYVKHPELFPWNLPEKRNFYNNLAMRALCYVGKCIPVLRGGTLKETQRTLDLISYLLSCGESIMIFPEGGRSRTGRVDVESSAYAVGRILQSAPGARVLCIYLRGKGQDRYSDYPKPGEEFDISLKMIAPTTQERGLRASKAIATQVIRQLSDMELSYFESAASLHRQ